MAQEQGVVPNNPFAMMEAMDDQNIVQRLQGRVSEAWVYSVTEGGRTVEGLSADGVEEAARFLAKENHEVIRELECSIESESETEARFTAKAGRYRLHVNEDTGEIHEILLDTAIRGKRQPKRYGSGAFNQFWYETGVTKAVRNAKMALLPEELIAVVIENAKSRGRVQTAADEQRPARRQPATKTAEENGDGKARHELKKSLVAKFGEDEQAMHGFVDSEFPAATEGSEVYILFTKIPAEECERMIALLEA